MQDITKILNDAEKNFKKVRNQNDSSIKDAYRDALQVSNNPDHSESVKKGLQVLNTAYLKLLHHDEIGIENTLEAFHKASEDAIGSPNRILTQLNNKSTALEKDLAKEKDYLKDIGLENENKILKDAANLATSYMKHTHDNFDKWFILVKNAVSFYDLTRNNIIYSISNSLDELQTRSKEAISLLADFHEFSTSMNMFAKYVVVNYREELGL